MEGTEDFATAQDGTRLWWSDAGRGAPAVVLSDGIGCAGYVWRRLAPDLARAHRVVRWNYRGHGRSEEPRDPSRATLLDCVDDLLAVLDAAALDRAVLVGHSMGVQVCLEAHRRAPARVAALVLVCGSYGRPIDTFHDAPFLRAAFPFVREAVERFPRLARLFFRTAIPTDLSVAYALGFEVDGRRVDREDLVRYFRDLSDVDPPLFVRMLASASEHDAWDHLPRVDVPTLVVAGERDTFTPMWLSVKMHAAIPGSELLVLPGGTHVGPLEHPDAVAGRIEAFLAGRVAPGGAAGRGARGGGA